MRAEQASNSVLRVDLDQVQVQVQVQVQDQLNSPAKLQAQGCWNIYVLKEQYTNSTIHNDGDVLILRMYKQSFSIAVSRLEFIYQQENETTISSSRKKI